MSLNTKPQVSLGLVSHLRGSLTSTPGQRRTAWASGVPRSTSLAFSHHRSSFPQVDGTKPLTHRFSGTVNTEAGIFVAPLISLLPCHLNLHNTKLLSSYSKTLSPRGIPPGNYLLQSRQIQNRGQPSWIKIFSKRYCTLEPATLVDTNSTPTYTPGTRRHDLYPLLFNPIFSFEWAPR